MGGVRGLAGGFWVRSAGGCVWCGVQQAWSRDGLMLGRHSPPPVRHRHRCTAAVPPPPAVRQDLGVPAVGAGDGWALQDARVEAQPHPGQPEGGGVQWEWGGGGEPWVWWGWWGWFTREGWPQGTIPAPHFHVHPLPTHTRSPLRRLAPPGHPPPPPPLPACSTFWRSCRTARATRWSGSSSC